MINDDVVIHDVHSFFVLSSCVRLASSILRVLRATTLWIFQQPSAEAPGFFSSRYEPLSPAIGAPSKLSTWRKGCKPITTTSEPTSVLQ